MIINVRKWEKVSERSQKCFCKDYKKMGEEKNLLTLTMTVMSRRGVRGYHSGSGLFLLGVTAHGGMFSLPSATLRLRTRADLAAGIGNTPLWIKKPPASSRVAAPAPRTTQSLASGIATYESHSRTKKSTKNCQKLAKN